MHKTKALAIIIITLFALSAFSLPVSGTITGRHTLIKILQHVDQGGTLYVNFSDSAWYETGNVLWTKINSYEQGHLVAVNITGQTITGAQVWLWLSEQGGALIEENDAFYAGPFDLLDVTAPVTNWTYTEVTSQGATYWVGGNMIIGPIPTGLVIPKGTDYYVKLTDVSPATGTDIPSSDVAVSVNQWHPNESLTISPIWGPAGILISVTGMAWDPAGLVNITWSNETMIGAAGPDGQVVVALVSPDDNGQFFESFYAPDLMVTDMSNILRHVNAYYNATPSIIRDYANFTEYGRRWLQIGSVYGPSGDGMIGPGVQVGDTIWVAGNYFNPRGDVSLVWDWGQPSEQVLTIASVNGTGFFNTTITIPGASIGDHNLTAADFSYHLNATLSVGPTLQLNPTSGPVGTVVTATAWGFPYNETIVLIWDYTCWCYECDIEPLNLTYVDTDGEGYFTTTFVVPAGVGGVHEVWAYVNGTSTFVESASFTVIPTLTVVPGSAINNGTWIQVVGSGLMSYSMMWDEGYEAWYDLDIDYEKNFEVWANCDGSLTFDIWIGASFEPGVHSIVLYIYESWDPIWVPWVSVEAYTSFMVTTAEDPAIIMKLDEIIMKLDDVNASLIDIMASIDAIDIDFTVVQDDIATALTTVLAELTGIETIATNAATAATQASTSAGTAAQSASDAKTAAEATQGTVSGINTAVYLAIILSLIAALASIIAVITLQRKVA